MTSKETTFDKSPTVWALGDHLRLANTPQDYTGGFITSSPCQPKADSSLILLPQDLNQTSESNFSNSSDQESGIADVSCRSPLSEDSARDADSDEAAYSAAWETRSVFKMLDWPASHWTNTFTLYLYIHWVTRTLTN